VVGDRESGLSMASRTHNYTRQRAGENYVIEPIEGDRFSMTGYGAGIRPGDFILLQEESRSVRYRVEQIDYYADPLDLWMALLQRWEPT
jgi:hypothetical protein